MRQDSAQIISSLEFFSNGRLFESAGIKIARALTVEGKRLRRFKTTIGTSDTTIPLGDLANIGLCQFENDNPALPQVVTTPVVTNVVIPTPTGLVVTPQGVAGSTTRSYKVQAVMPNGDLSPVSAIATTTTSNATIDTNNFITISWDPVPGASVYNIYRTVSGGTPSTTGNIATTSTGQFSFNDMGAPGDGTSPPAFSNASTWSYKVVARGADGSSHGIASAVGSTSTGRAILSVNNYNFIKFPPCVDGAFYDIYRTVSGGSPATLGFFATVGYDTIFVDVDGLEYVAATDTGTAGDGSTAPTTTPFDFRVQLGSNGTLYDIALHGQDIHTLRWNSATLHAKAVTNPTDIWVTLIEN